MGYKLRRETTLPLKHIAEQVHLGTSKRANARLHEWKRIRNPTTTASTKLQK
jgi:hypothetical protein